jgi:hypothetical protein
VTGGVVWRTRGPALHPGLRLFPPEPTTVVPVFGVDPPTSVAGLSGAVLVNVAFVSLGLLLGLVGPSARPPERPDGPGLGVLRFVPLLILGGLAGHSRCYPEAMITIIGSLPTPTRASCSGEWGSTACGARPSWSSAPWTGLVGTPAARSRATEG